jgi:hypothetical protein
LGAPLRESLAAGPGPGPLLVALVDARLPLEVWAAELAELAEQLS